MTILIDIHEPIEIEMLVAQSTPVSRLGLNQRDCADYLWYAIDGHTIQVERKQIGEILSGMDSVEEQLRREIVRADETLLIYEGTFEPLAKQACQSWRRARDKQIMIPGRSYNTSYAGVQAWLSQLDKAGITVVHTFDYASTAITLVALYNNSQKTEHTTLKRYIKEKIYPMPQNPHVASLMGIKGAGVGEEKAKALIERFGTFWYTLNQDVESLAETLVGEEKPKRFGVPSAKRLLKAIGRQV